MSNFGCKGTKKSEKWKVKSEKFRLKLAQLEIIM
jgi:hypothetical protein